MSAVDASRPPVPQPRGPRRAPVSGPRRAPVRGPRRAPVRGRRRAGVVALSAVVIALAIALAAAMAAAILSATAMGAPSGGLPQMLGLGAPYAPMEADGAIDGSATVDEIDAPAIARLDPALLAALTQAVDAAAADGMQIEITSGWRSRAYQQWLFDDAVATYGSVEVARQWVAAPDASSHVTGSAVDIGPVDAQFWLLEHGPTWGLCQVYGNERWHFELATDAGGACPELRPDAAG